MSTSYPGESRPSGTRRTALASVAAAALVVSGALGAAMIETRPVLAQNGAITVPPQVQAQAPASFADVVDTVKPAVVAVKVSVENALDDGGSRLETLPPQLRDLFRRFGDEGQTQAPRRQRGQAQGSGFFISADGFVVTNNHVVERGRAVQVTTDDGRTLDARVIGTDPKSDLALLKVEAGGPFPYVKLASALPRVGDWVVAIGNPFGLGGTVTSGIVSARGRDIGAGPYDDFLQIDAPINRGNSGGPTFNLRGEVVGVNTAIASNTGGSIGLAFAIPATTVRTVIDQLRDHGSVARGFLGVQIQPLTRDLAEGLGIDRVKGALINTAQPNTPAARAGLRSGDVIVTVNGEAVADARDLTRRIAGLPPGTTIELGYLRDGRERKASIELGTLPGGRETASVDRGAGNAPGAVQDRTETRLGLQLAPAGRNGAGEEGVTVTNVDPDGPAAGKGIRQGDVILEVAGKAVANPSDVSAGIKAARDEGKRFVLLRVKNDDGIRFVAIALSKAG